MKPLYPAHRPWVNACDEIYQQLSHCATRLRRSQGGDKVTRMDDSADSDMIAAITPDVMECLRRSQFFEKLDDLLSPSEGSGSLRKQCGGDYKLSEEILRSGRYDSEALRDIFDVLRSQGGCCDCEILYNVTEASRLKAKYWRSRAHNPNVSSGQ